MQVFKKAGGKKDMLNSVAVRGFQKRCLGPRSSVAKYICWSLPFCRFADAPFSSVSVCSVMVLGKLLEPMTLPPGARGSETLC